MSERKDIPIVVPQSSQQREVFVNRRAIVTLTVSTIALLALLQPNRELMLEILDNANDPTIALAFLNVLRDEEEPSEHLDYLTAKQLARLNEFEQAIAIVEPVGKFEETPFQDQTYQIYARSLWQMATTTTGEGAESAAEELVDFLRTYINGFSNEDIDLYTRYALQISEPELAYELKTHSTVATHQELLLLANQAGLTPQAYTHALAIYEGSQSFGNIREVLSLAQQLSYWEEGVALAEDFSSRPCDNDCLQALIDFVAAAGSIELAAQLSYTKAENSSSPQDWLQASQLGLSISDLAPATIWLEQVVDASEELAVAHRRQLVDLYLWQQRYGDARDLLLQFVTSDDPSDLIRFAINVSYAALDVRALEYFLFALAERGEATLAELREWTVYADRLRGANYVVTQLRDILDGNAVSRGLDEEALKLVEVELGRFQNHAGLQARTVALWNERHGNDLLVPSGEYTYDELAHFIRAFIDTNRPQEAMQLASRYLEFSELNTEQLSNINSLATFVGDRGVLREVQNIHLAQGNDALDPYTIIVSHDSTSRSDREQLWQFYSYYQQRGQGQMPEQARILLDAILNGAIEAQDPTDIAQVKAELLAYELSSPELQRIRLQIATFEGDNVTARRILEQLIRQFPDNQTYQVDAMWLAIDEQDLDWLNELYWQLLPNAMANADLTQLMAAASQALDIDTHSEYWYAALYESNQASAADLLSYAGFLQEQGRETVAQALRWQVISTMADELRETPDGEISYRSLLALFVGEAQASVQLTEALAENASAENIGSILFSQSRNALQRVAYWQAIAVLGNSELNESVQLSLALARNDIQGIRSLAMSSQSLSELERASALAQIGEHELAWQYGEPALNAGTSPTDLAPLQRFLASEHWHRSHGWKYALGTASGYDVGNSDLQYYRPLGDGQLQISYAAFEADKSLQLESSYRSNLFSVAWQNPQTTYRYSLQDRYGQQNSSFEMEGQWQLNPWISTSLSADWNSPATQSENLLLFGRYTAVQLGAAWQVTSRTSLSASLQSQRYDTDFSEHLGDGQQLSLRLSETLMRMPNWQLYMQYDLQKNTVRDISLNRLQQQAGTINTLTPQSFLAEKYHRVAIGQTLVRGTVGRPGPDVKGSRYILDTSVGYNVELAQPDFSVSVGWGFRVFGGDELSITGNWQNADLTGNNFTQLNISYFMDF